MVELPYDLAGKVSSSRQCSKAGTASITPTNYPLMTSPSTLVLYCDVHAAARLLGCAASQQWQDLAQQSTP